jgi:hypothetical protein
MTVRFVVVAAFVLAGLVAAASLGGILLPSVYARETAVWTGQAVGQDWVDLLLTVPWLVLTSIGMSRGSRRSALLLAGGVFYTLYEFLIYAFSIHFNALFLIYCATLGLSLFSGVCLTASLLREPAFVFSNERSTTRAAAVVLLAIAVLFGGLWLGEVVPAVVQGTFPKSVAEAGVFTNPVHVIDLSFLLPAHFLVAVWLLRRRPVGIILAPILLSFGVLMSLSIAGIMVVMHLQGVEANLAVAGGMIGISLLAGAPLLILLRRLR